jgi:hypothetical protein
MLKVNMHDIIGVPPIWKNLRLERYGSYGMF